jgi:hypothetical protein
MYKTYFTTQMTRWLTKLNQLFKGTAGNTDMVLYVDNPTGRFAFKNGYAVVVNNIVTTADGITAVRQAILDQVSPIGYNYVNQYNKTIDTYNQTTQVWDQVALGYDAWVLPGRYVYSPWNRTVWYSTSYGELKRLKTTTLTVIG